MADGLERLTRRERQIFDLLILGYTNPEMAQRLALSVRTVETHRANLQDKLGLETRAKLVALALRRGLLDLPHPLES